MPEDRVLIEFEGEDNTAGATRSAQRNIRKIGDAGQSSARRVQRGYSAANRTLARTATLSLSVGRNLRNVALGAGVLGAAGVVGLGLMTKAAIDLNSNLTTIGTTLGLTAQEVFTLVELSKGFGVTLEQVQSGVLGLAIGAQRLGDSEKGAADFLAFMNVSAAEFTSYNLPKQIDTLRQRLRQTGPEGLQTAIKLGLVEKETGKLFAALAQTNMGLSTMAQLFIQTGRAPRQATVASLSAVEDVVNSLGGRFTVLRQEVAGAIGEALLPQLQRLDDHMASPEFIRTRNVFTDWLTTILAPAFETAGDAVADLYALLAPTVSSDLNPFDPFVTPLVRVTESGFQTRLGVTIENLGGLVDQLKSLRDINLDNIQDFSFDQFDFIPDTTELSMNLQTSIQEAWDKAIADTKFELPLPELKEDSDSQASLINQLETYVREVLRGVRITGEEAINILDFLGISGISGVDLFAADDDVEVAVKLGQVITGAVAIIKRRVNRGFIGFSLLDLFRDIGDEESIDLSGVITNSIAALGIAFSTNKGFQQTISRGLEKLLLAAGVSSANRIRVGGGLFAGIGGAVAGAIAAEIAGAFGASTAEQGALIGGAIVASVTKGLSGGRFFSGKFGVIGGAISAFFIADLVDGLTKADSTTEVRDGITDLMILATAGAIGVLNPGLGIVSFFVLDFVKEFARANRQVVIDAIDAFFSGALADAALQLGGNAIEDFARFLTRAVIDNFTLGQLSSETLQEIEDFFFGVEEKADNLQRAIGEKEIELSKLLSVDLNRFDIFLDEYGNAVVVLKEQNDALTTTLQTGIQDAADAVRSERENVRTAFTELFAPVPTTAALVMERAGGAINAGLIDVVNDFTGQASAIQSATRTAFGGVDPEAQGAVTTALNSVRTQLTGWQPPNVSFAGAFANAEREGRRGALVATDSAANTIRTFVAPTIRVQAAADASSVRSALNRVNSLIQANPTQYVTIDATVNQRTQQTSFTPTVTSSDDRSRGPADNPRRRPGQQIPGFFGNINTAEYRRLGLNVDGSRDIDGNPYTYFARGGIARRPTRAVIAENGPEIVLNQRNIEEFGLGQGGVTVNIGTVETANAEEFVDELIPMLNRARQQNRL